MELKITSNLTVQEYIDFLQRYIIVHSYIYYELNNNVISDRVYDKKSKELVYLKNKYPDLWKTSQYYDQFTDDYNGATGFTLFYDLDEIEQEKISHIALLVLHRR